MYIPRSFEMDTSMIPEFVRCHPFGQLLVADNELVRVGLAPFILDQEGDSHSLVGHVARASELARTLKSGQAASIFLLGPHAYVSPRNYVSGGLVPTWNYRALLAEGTLNVIEDHARLRQILEETTRAAEGPQPGAWRPDWSDPAMTNLLDAIVGVQLRVQRWSGKEKLSQNRGDTDYTKLKENFAASHSEAERELAAAMPPRREPAPGE